MKTLEDIIAKLPEEIRLPIYEAFKVFKEDVIYKELQEIKGEIKKVWQAINELAEAQKRTEQRVSELAEAQKRTDERVSRLEKAVEELAEAQKRTEQRVSELAEAQKRTDERVSRLEKAVEELAEAQKRTEERVNELAEAQKRTEQRVSELAEAQKRTDERVSRLEKAVEELAEAQKRTEEELKKLIVEHRKTREQLGGLSHAFGYLLEDRAIQSLPPLLKKEYNIEVIGELKREYMQIRGEYIEVNIYGKVKKNSGEYTLIGEAKSKLSKRIIDNFIKKANKVSKRTIKVLVSYVFTPEIKKYAEEKGIILIPSYKLKI